MPTMARMRAVVYSALAAFSALTVLGLLILQTRPLVLDKHEGSQQYLAQTRHFLNTTVRDPQTGEARKTITLTAEDLAAAANFVLMRKQLAGQVDFAVDGSRLNALATIKLPIEAVDLFLNIKVVADDGNPQAVIKQVRFGHLALPKPVVALLVRGILYYTPLLRYRRVSDKLVEEVHIADNRLQVTLKWNREAMNRAQDLLTDIGSRERLLAYSNRLTEIVNESGLKRFIRLGALTQPLFALAENRSTDNDPIEENRALIFVLSAYVNEHTLSGMLSPNGEIAAPTRRLVLLNRRVDTAQHFMASAAMTLSGHRTLTDMIGLAKEMDDTHNGSGFSFTDLAADRAGSLFGRTAVHSEEKARRAQSLLSQTPDESLFMPNIKDLPENLDAADFAARYKDVASPEFQVLKEEIEARIKACALYNE